jgi:predicted alpha/beta superfamily hydrolase
MQMQAILPGVEMRDLRSHIIDQDMRLFIKLPWRYDRSDATYPVLYSLDGNRSFPLYSTTSLILETPGTGAKETIVVGVGYQTDSDRIRGLAQWAAWRNRDLTPVRDEESERYWRDRLARVLEGEYLEVQSGGAPQFLRALREEVIPYVEANYRTAPGDRGLAGYSSGGLFTLYALFQKPDIFTRYFAGSPDMPDLLFEYEEEYAVAHDDLAARLLITVGGKEAELLEPIRRMVDRLRSRGYPGLEVLTHVFESEDHSSAYAPAVSRALCVLFNER